MISGRKVLVGNGMIKWTKELQFEKFENRVTTSLTCLCKKKYVKTTHNQEKNFRMSIWEKIRIINKKLYDIDLRKIKFELRRMKWNFFYYILLCFFLNLLIFDVGYSVLSQFFSSRK